MSEPVTVVAVIRAKPGMGPAVIEAFREVSPLVHEEAGCELYAAHLEQGGDTVVMVERWTTRADLDAHSTGAPIQRLTELSGHLRAAPAEVFVLDTVPLGDERKGALPV